METTNISPAIESHKPLSQQYEAKVILTDQWAGSQPT